MLSTVLSALHLKRKITLTVIGLDGVGKTSFVSKIAGQPVVRSSPVCGVQTTHIVHGRYSIELLVLPGAPCMRHAWPYYYPISHGIVFVYDANDMERMDEANDEMDKLFEVVANKPVLILTINQDKANALSDAEICETSTLKNFPFMHTEIVGKSRKQTNQLKDDFKNIMNAIDKDFSTLNEGVIKAKEEQEMKRIREEDERVKIAMERREQRENKVQEVYEEAPHESLECEEDISDVVAGIINQLLIDVVLGEGEIAVGNTETVTHKKQEKESNVNPHSPLPPSNIPERMERGDCVLIDLEETQCEKIELVRSMCDNIDSVDSICEEIECEERINWVESPCEQIDIEETWHKLIYSEESLCDQIKFEEAICEQRGSDESLSDQMDIEETWHKLIYSDESLCDRLEPVNSPVKQTDSEESICEEIICEESPSGHFTFIKSLGEKVDSDESIGEEIVRKETPWELLEFVKSFSEIDSKESIGEETPVEKIESEEGPIEEVESKETSVEEVESEDTLFEKVECKERPVEEIECKERPVEKTKCQETPIELMECEETTIEQIMDVETPIKELESEETPPIEQMESEGAIFDTVEEKINYLSDELAEEIVKEVDVRVETGGGECRGETANKNTETGTQKKQKKTRKFAMNIKSRKVHPLPEMPYQETPRQMEKGDSSQLQ